LALDGAGAVDWSWDIPSNRLTWSDRYREFFGEAAEAPQDYQEWINNNVHAEDRPKLQRRIEQMLSDPGDNIWREEFRIVVPKRGTVWLGSFGLMKRNEDGVPQRMTGIFVDVTQRREAEFELRIHQEAQAKLARLGALGEYSAGIAHEINQPLMAARVYLRLAGDAVANAEAKEEIVSAVANATAQIDRAGDVIRRLREFIQFGTVDATPSDLLGIARSSIRMLQPELERAEIIVAEDFPADLTLVLVDPLQIELVLTNLLRNSIEAISTAHIEQGRVTIKASHVDRDWVEVAVEDTGPGFSADESRPPPPLTTTKTDGLGLGMSLSKSIIEAHGGRFWKSYRLLGAAVHFTLPKSKEIAPWRSSRELH
jgi:two-component system, LuxR family, sensor kinase FixL